MPTSVDDPLPATLALVEDDAEFGEFLTQHLRGLGIGADRFQDSDELLTSAGAYDYAFYVLDLSLPGIDGQDLIRLLRRRTAAGILVVSGRVGPDVFGAAVEAGADMYLAKPVSFEQVVHGVRAVHRRAAAAPQGAWTLQRQAARLIAPDGAVVELSETDVALLEQLGRAQGGPVSRAALIERLGQREASDADNLLSAMIYRLRRRIERATPIAVPLQTQSRQGYQFRGELRLG